MRAARCFSGHATLALTLGAVVATAPASGATALERRVDTASAPHLALRQGGRPVTVHYVHLKDDYRDSAMFKSHLANLKQKVAFCVVNNPRIGRPVRAPAEFPDQITRVHHFEYFAPNLRISYKVGYIAQMAEDCSLIEDEERSASLVSSKGECEIDLLRKTARGVCDAGAHANAVAYPPPPGREQQEKTRAALEADPRLAERMAVLRRLTAGQAAASPTKRIAGLECQVVEGIPGISGCTTKAGSFVPNIDVEGVTLQRMLAKESQTAVEAKLDMPIDPAIFAPYLAGGYTMTAERK